ncbi:COX15/CtaA family protein [Akkermansiaceae bacterium]|nr:COX15/CtaA family protein [Akkermansiaceae bacterium]
MKAPSYQSLAIAALASVLTLIFIGAIVRVSGAGMGCPDWPTCWGLLIPPTSVEQVDFDRLPVEKFQKKAEGLGRDPSTITRESLRRDFNPRHVWTEFLNRLSALPVGFFTLATFIASFGQRKRRPHVFWLSFAALLLVLANAWMGARVVFSGISPGILSIHLALAMLLICVLTYCVWAGTEKPRKLEMSANARLARLSVALLLLAVVAEGIMGSQIREMTDELSKAHLDSPRATWIGELEGSTIYLIHRSFSWAILIGTAYAFFLAKKSQPGGVTPCQIGVMAIVIAQMVLGLVMAQIHIYSWVQVLHVGLAALLLSLVFRWLLLVPDGKRPLAMTSGR